MRFRYYDLGENNFSQIAKKYKPKKAMLWAKNRSKRPKFTKEQQDAIKLKRKRERAKIREAKRLEDPEKYRSKGPKISRKKQDAINLKRRLERAKIREAKRLEAAKENEDDSSD